jgi:hypothetical protein
MMTYRIARGEITLQVETSWILSQNSIRETHTLEPFTPVHLIDGGEGGEGIADGYLTSGLIVVLRSK